MSPWLQLALREIRNHPRFAAFFAFNLALGLCGFVALDAFEAAMVRELRARSKGFLGGDVAVTASRPLGDAEVSELDALAGAGAEAAQVVTLYSMAGGASHARLVELHAIDERFPLRGAVVLEGAGEAGPEARAQLREREGAWIDPVLLGQLGVARGDAVRVGARAFRVLDSVARDSGRPTSGFSIAPRIYVALPHLASTGLVATGSRVQYTRLYRLPDTADAERVVRRMREATGDPRLQVQSHEDASRSLARSYGAVSAYLGLVSLIALFLAGLGAAYLYRAFLARRLREVAILLSLGASRGQAQTGFLAQLWLLAAGAALLACALGALLLPAAVALAGDLVPEGTAPSVGPATLGAALILSLAGSTAACLPLLVRLRSLRPAELFREHARPSLERRPGDVALLLPALALCWGLAVWRVGDLRDGSLFSGIFAGALLVLLLAGVAGLRALAWLPARSGLAARLALRQLARSPGSTVSGFVAVALCALLVSLAPQLRAVLDRDLDAPDAPHLPSLFLFDIQPDQVAPLAGHVAQRGAELQRISPMVRARLEAIDGRSLLELEAADGDADDDEGARRLRTRHYNLTYTAELSDAERLVEGVAFSGPYGGKDGAPAEISLEVEFSERLGVGLGARLAFDVQGVPVEGVVTSLREVRWNSLQPNFFVTFQPGVLEQAPQVFLASVPTLPGREREALQTSIAEAFPNVSAIDVTAAVKRLLGLLTQLQWALASTASLSLLVGLVLVFSIARDQARARRWETNLLKVLGADFRQIRASVDVEFGLLGLLAALAGGACSLVASAILARAVLETAWTPAWGPLGLTLVAVPAICVLTARAATRAVLRERPLVLLQAGES